MIRYLIWPVKMSFWEEGKWIIIATSKSSPSAPTTYYSFVIHLLFCHSEASFLYPVPSHLLTHARKHSHLWLLPSDLSLNTHYPPPPYCHTWSSPGQARIPPALASTSSFLSQALTFSFHEHGHHHSTDPSLLSLTLNSVQNIKRNKEASSEKKVSLTFLFLKHKEATPISSCLCIFP